jgi:hypothetical protein
MVSAPVRHALFALSSNECAFPGCIAPIVDGPTRTLVGEICHIRAQSPGGPRYESLPPGEINAFPNLIILCQHHHKVVDANPEEFPVEAVERMKQDHESRARELDRDEFIQALQALQALRPTVPDEWWRRPGAPVFRLHGSASSRPLGSQPTGWTFEGGVAQERGEDVGDFRARFAGDLAETELGPGVYEGTRLEPRWRLPALHPSPRSRERWEADSALGLGPTEFAIEVRFWWDSAERCLLLVWPTIEQFQERAPETRYLA